MVSDLEEKWGVESSREDKEIFKKYMIKYIKAVKNIPVLREQLIKLGHNPDNDVVLFNDDEDSDKIPFWKKITGIN